MLTLNTTLKKKIEKKYYHYLSFSLIRISRSTICLSISARTPASIFALLPASVSIKEHLSPTQDWVRDRNRQREERKRERGRERERKGEGKQRKDETVNKKSIIDIRKEGARMRTAWDWSLSLFLSISLSLLFSLSILLYLPIYLIITATAWICRYLIANKCI